MPQNNSIQAKIEQNQAPTFPDLPHLEQLGVKLAYVAIDKQCDGYKLRGVRVSPYFRTKEEARAFLASCNIEGAYCIGGAFSPENPKDAEQCRIMLFGSETEPAMTGAICYQIEEN